MTLKPASVEELQRALADAPSARQRIERVDLSALNRIVEYHPEDMTVTVDAGVLLSHLQARLKESGQWLPIDPPFPQRTTIADLISCNLSGPRRFGFGTIRDYLLGLSVVLADGRLIKSGGKVVKNVAGYDVQKLFVGSHGTLGVVVRATFKVLPLPFVERVIQSACESVDQAASIMQKILAAPITPVALDIHNMAGAYMLVLAFSGTSEEVEWQIAKAGSIAAFQPGSLDYDRLFWEPQPAPFRKSVLPSNVPPVLRELGPAQFVARAGNGTVYYRGGKAPSRAALPQKLIERLKATFDPNRVLPELPL